MISINTTCPESSNKIESLLASLFNLIKNETQFPSSTEREELIFEIRKRASKADNLLLYCGIPKMIHPGTIPNPQKIVVFDRFELEYVLKYLFMPTQISISGEKFDNLSPIEQATWVYGHCIATDQELPSFTMHNCYDKTIYFEFLDLAYNFKLKTTLLKL